MQFYGEVCGHHVLLGTAVQAADKLHLRQTEPSGSAALHWFVWKGSGHPNLTS